MSRISIIEKLKEGMTPVHCKTEDQAKEFVRICYDNGIEWYCWINSGKNVTHWNDYYEETCYRVDGDALTYAAYDYYEIEDYEVITFEEFMEEYNMKEFTKADLRTGMIVVLRDGSECIVVKGMEHGFKMYQDNIQNQDIILNSKRRFWELLEYFLDDLTSEDRGFDYHDIMEVYLAPHPYCMQDIDYEREERKLLWKREEVKELTVEEISELLGYKVKVVGGN